MSGGKSWLLAVALAGLGPLRAADEPPAFRVNSQLVELDVVVHGKNGPVANLTKNDFAVLDNGKPQQISTFSVHSSAEKKSVKAAPLAPGVVSNRLTRNGEEPPSPTVVLWDALNTETSNQAWVRNQVISYLRTLHPGDPVAIYILVKNLNVVQDFTTDSTQLIQALTKTKVQQSTDLQAPGLVDLNGQINFLQGTDSTLVAGAGMQQVQAALAEMQTASVTAVAEMTDFALRDQVYITQAALEAIAEHLSGMPGRKKLVWISGSFPALQNSQRHRLGTAQIEILDFSPQLNHAIQALNGANVAVYPLDPRGITTGFDSPSNPRSFTNPGQANAASGLAPGALTAPGIDTMNLLAGGTGGEAFYSTNDAAGAMKTIMEDGDVTYRMGFYPAEAKLDGAYHALSVKVARKGTGIDDVRARKGYFALDANNSANGHWRERVTESMRNPLESTQVGLRASAAAIKDSPGVYNLELVLDLEDLHLERAANGRWVAAIALGTQFSPSESTKGSLETIRISLTESRLREALKNGYSLHRKLAGGNASGQLHVVVEDAATGALGSVHVPVGPQ